jgi:hypothetical protein
MFELLVPAEESQLSHVNGNKQRYDMEIRPRLTVQAIQQLQDAQVEPDVWKMEGLDRPTRLQEYRGFGPPRWTRQCGLHHSRAR